VKMTEAGSSWQADYGWQAPRFTRVDHRHEAQPIMPWHRYAFHLK
jgi:hypothetical protein